MDRIVVAGSGASGVHFALTVLKKGRRVLMLDVGRPRPAAVRPEDDFNSLKRNLTDPVEYFLGPRYEALILPGHGSEYYGFPPSKDYVFREVSDFRYQAEGFAPLVSFAAGGLAEAWTGGSYPLNDAELAAFPFGYGELGPCYAEVAGRIGICGADDDLARFFPLHDGLMPPLDLDEHSSVLLAAYVKRRRALNEKHNCYIGRSRIATLSSDQGGRKRCSYLGRCLWGCPTDSLYTPSVTLLECRQYPNFEYVANAYVSHFRFGSNGRITRLVLGDSREVEVGTLVLAAGTLSSSRIFLESIRQDSGKSIQLRGLMDNRQILMPFVNLRMLGSKYNPNSYQYHQLAIGVGGLEAHDYIHGLVTTLKTALIHPVVQSLPFDLGSSVSVFRHIHAALGLVNINFPDSRREENYLTLDGSRLVIHYQPGSSEAGRIRKTRKAFQRILWKLGCVAPAAMTHLRPMGASVHYAGTIPMAGKPAPLTCSPNCRSHDFSNLYFVDGTTFPDLSAKNLTFTLMANAVRVAEKEF